MNKIIKELRKELKKNVDVPYRGGSLRFFKEEVKIIGVRSNIVRKIASKYFKEIKDLDKKEIYKLAEELLKPGYMEERIVAFQWIKSLSDRFEKSDFKIFESWLKKYCTNWADVDDFCTHAFGDLVAQYPELIPKVFKWTNSKNRWLRRASAVIFVHYPLRKNYLKEIFKIADILLLDKDDLVQKGYGWMLKTAADLHQKKVFDFVMARKDKMPRTALRYAIEKMPEKMRKKAMKKN